MNARVGTLVLSLLLASCRREPESDVEGRFAFYGFDYARMKAGAFRDPAALRPWFLMSLTVDAASAEAYSDDLMKLVAHWGETIFLRELESINSIPRERVIGGLAYETCFGENEREWIRFSARYPRVAETIAASMHTSAR